MFAVREPASLMLIALIIATIVVCWRTVIKFVVISVIALAVFGLLELIQDMH